MISTEQWRAAIGGYVPSMRKGKWRPDSLKIPGTAVSLAVRITLFLLLVSTKSVESNPGPSTFTAAKDELLKNLEQRKQEVEQRLESTEKKLGKAQEMNVILKDVCLNQAQKLEQLESQSRRDNLILHNIPTTSGEQETWAETEQKVRSYFEKIGADKEVKIDRAHRLRTKNKPQPIIVKLNYYKDKERVMEKAREAKKQRQSESRRHAQSDNTESYITEDYTVRTRKVRQMLRPKLEEAINAGKKAFFSYDKLVIDGVSYWYDDVKQSVVNSKPKNVSCLEYVTTLGNM